MDCESKTCKRCLQSLPISDFYKARKYRQSYCKSCCKAWQDDYRKTARSQENRRQQQQKRGRDSSLEWRAANPEAWALIRKNCNQRHVDTLSDNYVKQQISQMLNVPFSEIPAELVELKRQQLEIARLSRNLKKAAAK